MKVVDYAAVQTNPEMWVRVCVFEKRNEKPKKRVNMCACACVCVAAPPNHLPSGLHSKLLPKQEPIPDIQKGIDVVTINFL